MTESLNNNMKDSYKLFPHFQPILGIASGKIIGYEALARRHDANGNIITAGDLFSGNLVDTATLIELDRDLRWQALEKFSQLHDNTYLAINISTAWLEYINDFNNIPTIRMLEKLNIDRNRIIIEITDTQDEIEKLIEIVKIYRKIGLKVAIDDFGAGFSQLERVMTMRPDIIKIDMALMKLAAKGGITGDVVQLLARLSKRTGCRIVCEGVETTEEFLFGLSCGAQFLQGHLFSPAIAEFQHEEAYTRHINSLRTKFVARSVQQQSAIANNLNDIKSLIIRLKHELQQDFDLNILAGWKFEETGILRFYLCDNNGLQTSPNFNFSNNQWFTENTKIGFNWSWRSYFYQLLALEKTGPKEKNQFVTSERYKDFDSDQTCKTLTLRLDSERILLVDIKAEWT